MTCRSNGGRRRGGYHAYVASPCDFEELDVDDVSFDDAESTARFFNVGDESARRAAREGRTVICPQGVRWRLFSDDTSIQEIQKQIERKI